MMNDLQAQSGSPNIILILADDQGWGTTSIQMDPEIEDSKSDYFKTPNLERLAKSSVVFSQGYSAHPNCSPSRASLLTGKSPARLNMTDIIERNTGPLYEGNYLIPPQHVNEISSKDYTIAEWIKKFKPEYRAAHFGKWHLGNGGPSQHGFDTGDGPTSNAEGDNNPPSDPKRIYSTTDKAKRWMEQQVKDGKPFYLQISHYAVHLSMDASPKAEETVSTWEKGERHNHSKFAAMTLDFDNALGDLLNTVNELGIRENTYIIYTSDNGTYPTSNPSNINGPLHGWKASLWEGGTRVPFMIDGPGISAGRLEQQVVGYDLFPTICEWLGIHELPEGYDGGSLANLLNGKSKSVERPNDFLVFHFPHYQLQKASHPATSIYWGDYKMIKFYETGTFQLYDLKSDLSEQKNLSYIYPEIIAQMDDMMEDYLERVNAKEPVVNDQYTEDSDPGRLFKDRKLRIMREPYFINK
ncbi:sulfatase [Echinicola sp. CAU 1574]|uniref:Sulfatase n=1 Tax=Echinicola arenosa TaxID=2774144 RepID=A0ABR9AR88_9BACT|nr:sulfatase [Echinicola arenosa]MBD8490881.1 sulfatase [Echinicola arenosa]